MSISKKNQNPENIRRIRFGLRVKFIFLLSLIIVILISVISVLMYFSQKMLLEEEKKSKAEVLVQILSGPAEFYLDKTIKTSDRELSLKYESISREAWNFKKFNEDIEKIILCDEKGRIRFSTSRSDYRRRQIFPYIKKSLEQQKEEPAFYDFEEPEKADVEKKDKEEKDSGSYISRFRKFITGKEEIKDTVKLRAITYPVFLQKGNVVDLISDFNKYYMKYHNSDTGERNVIYNHLWKKYRNSLTDSYRQKRGSASGRGSKRIDKTGDIDFLFHELFGNIMTLRDRRVLKKERWLFRERWLVYQKLKKEEAYSKDLPDKAKEINDLIISRMKVIASKVEGIRRLGSIAIIFNIDKIESELDKTLNKVLLFAVIMGIACLVSFYFILNLMIRNLKKLEKWAVSVSAGNLDTKIVINTNDEIGRLSDIFNNMIDQIAVKYNLEKFLSSSAISMIGKRSDSSSGLTLGHTERRNLVFLFSDVRGFTSFSEKNDPSIVMEILNYYLDLQSNIIMSNNGDIDSFIGDEIMAHFRGKDNVDRAIASAVQIMKAIADENVNRLNEKFPIFEVGIGIHGGDVVVGNIGTKARMDFTCIGDAVNLSSRLCSSASAGEILISKEIYEQSDKSYKAKNTAPITVKGKVKPIRIVTIKV